MAERIYNDTYNKWTKKWYPFIKIWYFLFIIICVINLFLYNNEIIKNWDFIVTIPMYNFLISTVLIILPYLIYGKYDYDYIEKYYPEISKKIWIGNRGNGIMKKLGYNPLYDIEYGADPIIDNMVCEREKFIPMFVVPFCIAIINSIIAEFIRKI
jgi:hypothetical protein